MNGDTDKVNELKVELDLGQRKMNGTGYKSCIGARSQRNIKGQGRLNK